MQDLFTAAALVLVLEGVIWALFPNGMKQAAARLMVFDAGVLRAGGLFFAAMGVLVVWLIRG